MEAVMTLGSSERSLEKLLVQLQALQRKLGEEEILDVQSL